MSVEYILTNPEQTDGIPGDLSTPTLWDVAFEAQRLANYNASLAKIAGDVNFLLALSGVSSTDTLSYAWTSNDAITVAPGLAISGDGTTHTIANATVLSLDSDLDTGTRAADKIYFVWIGTDSVSGLTKLKLSLNYETAPTNLLHAYRLRNFFNTNAGNSNIEQFAEALPDTWPVGVGFQWDAAIKPCGTFWARGQALSRTHGASARIFARLGTTWGVGDGSTTFNLPDTQGRSPMGAGSGSGLTARTLGTTLGAEAVALAADNNGPHSHDLKISNGISGAIPVVVALANANGYTLFATTSGGLGTPHNTVHPVLITNYIIKG